jgi:hypothetical protein
MVVLAFRVDGHIEQVVGPAQTTVGETGCDAGGQVQRFAVPQKNESLIRQTVQQLPAITRGGVTVVRNPGSRKIGGLPPGLEMKQRPVAFVRFCSISGRPLLRWPAVPDAERYTVRLFGSAGEVWSAETSETSISYAGSQPLKPGEGYRWSVSCPAKDGESELVCKGYVEVAAEEQARHAAALEELGEEADEAMLALHVMWFIDREMFPAALEAAERLAEQDPTDAAYQRLLADLYGRLGQPEEAAAAKERAKSLAPPGSDESDEEAPPFAPDLLRKLLEFQKR